MHPVLIDFFGYPLHAYSGLLVAAFVICSLLAMHDARTCRGLHIGPVFFVVLFICGFLGARALAILQTGNWAQLLRVLFIWEAGLVFYGGLIGALLGGWIFVTLRHMPLLHVADVTAVYAALGESIGRLGCFLNGCCWGTLCSLPWAVQFPKDSWPYRHHLNSALIDPSAPGSLPVHPTQLYLVVGMAVVAIVLRIVLKRTRIPGLVLILYCFMQGTVRFTVEMFRGDSLRPYLSLTTSQIISSSLIAGSILALLILHSRTESSASGHGKQDETE